MLAQEPIEEHWTDDRTNRWLHHAAKNDASVEKQEEGEEGEKIDLKEQEEHGLDPCVDAAVRDCLPL